MKKHNRHADLSQITPEVDELCSILAQAIERINRQQRDDKKKQ